MKEEDIKKIEDIIYNITEGKGPGDLEIHETLNFLKEKNIEYSLEKINQIFEEQSQEIPDHDLYSSTEEYATKVILYGRKSNLNKPIGFQ